MRNESGAGEEMKNLQSAMLKSVFKNSDTGARPSQGAAMWKIESREQFDCHGNAWVAAPGDRRSP
jgi:hypothetical protein